jgi:putative (di)nucleoside polyphosphate hydrolase
MDEYRKNVAIIVLNSEGQILLGHRRGVKEKGWQFPQGGMKEGESQEQALKRELIEETNLSKFETLAKSTDWIYYDWPSYALKKKPYKGQKQIYFVIKIDSGHSKQLKESKEFDAFRWVKSWSEVTKDLVDFKMDCYEKAYQQLREFLPE